MSRRKSMSISLERKFTMPTSGFKFSFNMKQQGDCDKNINEGSKSEWKEDRTVKEESNDSLSSDHDDSLKITEDDEDEVTNSSI